MFFKNLNKWSQNKLRAFIGLFATLYFMFFAIIPVFVVAIKYDLFKKAEYKLTATGLIVIIFVVCAGCKAIKWLVDKLPAESQKEQCLKYSLELVLSLVYPLTALWILHLMGVNFNLASSTIRICIWSFICGLIIENLFLKSLFNELATFTEAKHNKRVKDKEYLI